MSEIFFFGRRICLRLTDGNSTVLARLSPKEMGNEEKQEKGSRLVFPHLILWVAALSESCKAFLDKFHGKETLNVRLSVHGESKKQYLAYSCPLVNGISNDPPLVLCGVL